MSNHSIVKCLKINDKCKILKLAWKEMIHHLQGTRIKMTIDFSSENYRV